MYKDPTEFRERFAKWKAGEKPYKNGRISDEEYVRVMEKVAADNWLKWGEDSEDAALTRILNDNTYDYRGYYSKYPNSAANADTHWSDEFKTVWHPTFSLESTYSGKKSQFNPYGYPGGTWQGEFFNPQWYQLNPHSPGFYKDGYPKLPRFATGTEGELNMGPRLSTPNLETVRKNTIHEQPVSNVDPIGEFIVKSVGLTKGASIIGLFLKNLRLNRMKNTYRRIRSYDSDIENYTGKSVRASNIRFADEAARNLSGPDNPLYWLLDPIISGYTKLQSHPIIGPIIPF